MTTNTTPPPTERPPLALVTGASSGIGHALARELAEQGFDLVVTAEDTRLDAVAESLRVHGGAVRTVHADLRRPEGVESVYAGCADTGPLDVAALNAGVGQGGRFVDTELTDQLSIVDLNVRSTVHLARLVLGDMVPRGEGRVLITSSIASEMPGTYQSVYNASKSFLQSFSQALQEELRDTPVTVTSLMPGPTETDFFHRADMEDTEIGASEKDDPVDVAEQGVAAMLRGEDKVIAGSGQTKAQGHLSGLLPDRLKAALHARMAAPGSAG